LLKIIEGLGLIGKILSREARGKRQRNGFVDADPALSALGKTASGNRRAGVCFTSAATDSLSPMSVRARPLLHWKSNGSPPRRL